MMLKVISKRKNKYAHILGTSEGWCWPFPIKREADSHEALSLLFHRDGAPDTIIADGAKVLQAGKYRAKCKEADVYCRSPEPYSPWMNAAEGTIRELKKGSGRKMIANGSPKCLWGDCIELEAYICSHTAHDIYNLQNSVPETMMTGQIPDISVYGKYHWWQWVKFYDENAKYPEDCQKLGKWLGPSLDIGPKHCSKILKENGNYRFLTTF